MFSRFFIERPVFSWVIAIVIMLAGALSILRLPISQFPQIAPPQVSISATYPGASAETIENTVTQIIEQNLTGLDGYLYMSSTSDSTGRVSITVTFEAGTNPDMAQVQVQNKIQTALTTLPQVVQQMGVTETFGGGFVWLDHNDVAEVLTPGWSLVSDCQAVGPEGRATIRYRYGLTEVPERVSEAVLRLAAYYLRPSATPERATGEATDAGFIRYTLAGRDGATGLPEVDAAIEQFGRCRAVVM